MSRNALVFGGGGARGSYEIGVWKGLRELGWDFQVVTGTSVGALNGALAVQGDYDLAEELWLTITTEKVIVAEDVKKIDHAMLHLKSSKTSLKTPPNDEMGLSTAPLGDLLQKYVDEEAVRNSGIDFGIIALLMDPLKLIPQKLFMEDIPEGLLVDYLWASSSLYPVLKSHIIEGKHYIDGGAYDNIPVELALTKEVSHILAVDLRAIGYVRKPDLTPDQTICHIKPFWDLGPLFYFGKASSKRNLTLGYFDTLKAFGKKRGCYYTFDNSAFTTPNQKQQHRMELVLDIIEKEEKNPLLSLAAESAEHIMEKRFRKNFSVKDDLWIMAAESVGDLFHLSPTVEYTQESFTQKIKKEVTAYTLQQKVMDNFGFDKLLSLKKMLTSLDTLGRTILLKKYFETSSQGSFGDEALAVLFPQEFLAATFLWIVEVA